MKRVRLFFFSAKRKMKAADRRADRKIYSTGEESNAMVFVSVEVKICSSIDIHKLRHDQRNWPANCKLSPVSR